MKRKTREEKAITLIALIITIIILLILAVVAIRAVQGDGIIQHAKNAQTGYEEAQAKENSILSDYQQYLDNKGDLGPWKQNGSKVYMKNEEETIELEIGDIVNYNSKTGKTIEIEEKSFSSDSYNGTWKVLGIEAGRLVLVSSDNVGEINFIKGKAYIDGEEKLNYISSIYKDELIAESVRSINIDDVNKITKFNPKTVVGGIETYENEVTYTINNNENGEWTEITFTATKSDSGTISREGAPISTFNYIEDNAWRNLKEGSKTFINKGYVYEGSTVMSRIYNVENITDSKEYKLLFGESGSLSYWLASKVQFIPETGAYANLVCYGLRRVLEGEVSRYGIAGNGWNTTDSLGIRPVIILDKNIQIKINADGISYDVSLNS